MSTRCRPSVHSHINTAKQTVHEPAIKSLRSVSQFVCSCRLLHTAARLVLPAVAICGRCDDATCVLQFSSPETAAVQSVFPCSSSPLISDIHTQTHTHTYKRSNSIICGAYQTFIISSTTLSISGLLRFHKHVSLHLFLVDLHFCLYRSFSNHVASFKV